MRDVARGLQWLDDMKTNNAAKISRSSILRKTPSPLPAGARRVFGPIFVRRHPSALETTWFLEYSVKGFGCTVAVLDSDDAAKIDAAIDAWIADVNRRRAEHAARMAA